MQTVHPLGCCTRTLRVARANAGFALTDLLTVIGVAVVAVLLAGPALSRMRNASQADVSRANLKRLIRSHAAYSLANQDRWMNPFNPTTTYNGQQNTADPNWNAVYVPTMP